MGITAMATSREAGQALLAQLVAVVSLSGEKKAAAKFEEVEGNISALGYVLAQFLTGERRVPLRHHNITNSCVHHSVFSCLHLRWSGLAVFVARKRLLRGGREHCCPGLCPRRVAQPVQ
jgi:hypothetical protein